MHRQGVCASGHDHVDEGLQVLVGVRVRVRVSVMVTLVRVMTRDPLRQGHDQGPIGS